MLMPGYYLRLMRMEPDGVVPEEILIGEFYHERWDAIKRKERIASSYMPKDRELDIVHVVEQRQTISIEDALKTFNLSRRTIYNWMKEGMVEYVRTPAGSRRVLVDSLELHHKGNHRKSA